MPRSRLAPAPGRSPSAPQAPRASGAASAVRALRPHQWVKNGLLALPTLLAHQLGGLPTVGLAIVAFSLCASGTYVVNDLLDRAHDRAHPTKRTRPFASGALSAGTGVGMAVGLVGAGFGLAIGLLPGAFTAVLAVYTATTLAYSLWLKSMLLVDVLVLAFLYALRVVAGGAATGVEVSAWLLAFSLFFFLGLALLKRYSELRQQETGAVPADVGRGYRTGDAALVRSVGPACGLLAVLVFALYVAGPDVRDLYARPDLLWLATPPLLYWTLRVWVIAHRGGMDDDPVRFAVTDPASYVVVALVGGVLAAATGL